ncbi:MAG: DNA polymerase III subunit delta [Pseudomonadota bacterium]
MAALNSRNIESYLKNPDFAHSIYLIFGPDPGLVNERANLLCEKSGVDLSDPFAMLRMTADEATAEAGRISDEANTIGMFGGKRLIRIAGKTQRDLFKALKPLLDEPPIDALIIVEAGDLKKSVALRRNLESHKNSLCIPCYQDTTTALEMLIDQEIVSAGFTIDRETRNELRSQLGDNRQLSRNELKKLALYCDGRSTVTLEDVRAVVGDGSSLVLNDVIDSVVTGYSTSIQTVFPKAIASGNAPDMILLGTLRHFQFLQRLKNQMEKKRQGAGAVLSSARPPVHFSRKDAVVSALSIWDLDRISKAMIRLDNMMLECRKNASAATSIAGTTLLAISLEAQALKRR